MSTAVATPTQQATTAHRCRRCGRTLTDPRSIARGYGPTCARRITAAIETVGQQYKPHQIASATQLIEDGGLVVGPNRTCLAVASNGIDTYVVDVAASTCTCKAGQRGLRCYHLAAATALAA